MRRRIHALLSAGILLLVLAGPVLPVHGAGGGIGGGGWGQTGSGSTLAGPFSDVPDSHVNSDAIRSLKETNVVLGYGDGTFGPERAINRAEFLKITYYARSEQERLEFIQGAGTNCFTDVTNQWFAAYVCPAKKNGIVGGYPDGSFRPERNVTFVEAAKILSNMFRIGDPTLGNDPVWYRQYVQALAVRNAIPLSITSFDEPITRGEMAEMFYRLKNNVTQHASRSYAELRGEGIITGQTCQQLFERLQLPQIATLEGRAISPSEVAVPTGDRGGMGAGGGGGYVAGAPFTSTNVQVPGVDEGDIVKTDGEYLYVAKMDTVRIVKATPPAALKEIATVKLPIDMNKGESFYVSELYAEGNRLVVIGSYTAPFPMASDPTTMRIIPPWFSNPSTRVLSFDTSNKAAPKLVRSVAIQGNQISSRRIGDTLYSVNALWSYGPYMVDFGSGQVAVSDPYNPSVNQLSAALRANAQQKDIIPTVTDSAEGGQARPMAACGDVVLFPRVPSTSFLSVSAVPLSDTGKKVSSTLVVADPNATYSSPQNLYLTSTNWSQVRSDVRPSDQTSIYKFNLSSERGARFVASGSVPGSVLNQWSLDEYQGDLRVATTKNPSMGPRQFSASNVYVLDSKMNLVGQTKDLARGEQVYAVLFMGKRAVVQTYRQVDPLFTLDLSNPRNPLVKGALKIPGQPSMAQQWDDNHIVTWGYDDTALEMPTTGMPPANVGGIKLSLFDVSDLSNVREVQSVVIGSSGTASDAQYNHRAIMLDREKGLLAFPVLEQGYVSANAATDQCTAFAYDKCPIDKCQKTCVPSSCTTQDGVQVCTPDCNGVGSCKSWSFAPMDPSTPYTSMPVWQGAYVYAVSSAGFQLQGKITHFTEADKDSVNGQTPWWGSKAVQRVLRIGNELYTVSLGMVKANALPGLGETKSTTLSGE